MTFKIAVKAFIVKEDKLLIVKRAINDVETPDAWEIPGGRLNSEEDPKKGLIREVKEETNLNIEIIKELNIQHFIRSDGEHITMTIFLCKPLTDKIILSHEHSDYEWIQINLCKEKLISFFHEEVDIYNNLID